ncbi:MAG: hypothetical protein IPN76_26410 [Saprospiraceae bacterium]|nr:hypothetical protein [Saprospiraceae bacterium]
MSERIKYNAVNWVDGMKISKTEFIQLENFLLDQIRDGNSLLLNDFNFGMLPSHEPGRESVSLSVNSERVEIYQCRALTRAGARIEVVDISIPALQQPMQILLGGYDTSRVGEWYIVIKVNPFVRLPYGQPAPDSQPLRHLNAISQYTLEIVPGDQIQSPMFAALCLPVAKIKSGHSGIEQVKNYIPPYSTISASLELLKIHKLLEDDLIKTERAAVNILRKLTRKKEAEPSNVLAQDLYLFANNLVNFITSNLDSFRLLVPQQPPVYLATWFMQLSRVVSVSMRLLKEKDGLLNYFQNYIGEFSPAAFEATYDGMGTLLYNHFEIRSMTDRALQFSAYLADLLYRLESLDYEKLVKFDPMTGWGRKNEPLPSDKKGGIGKIVINNRTGEEQQRPGEDFGSDAWFR